jgi:drug/metabolite transporter (DMT)-like permease
MIAVVALYALLALTFPLAQYALQYADPLLLLTFRMLFAGTCLLMYVKKDINGRTIVIKKDDRWAFFQIALFHIYFAFVPEFWALQYLSSIKITFMYCLTPFISALLDYVLFKKKPTFYNCVGGGLAASGLLFLLLSTPSGSHNLVKSPFTGLPELMLIVAIISATYAWFLLQNLVNKGYQLPFVNGTAMLGGGFFSLITLLIARGLNHTLDKPFVYAIQPFFITTIALVILSNVIVYNLYGMLVQRYSITFISLAGYLSPIFGALYSWLFFGDLISWHYIVTFMCIYVGLKVFYIHPRSRTTLTEPT